MVQLTDVQEQSLRDALARAFPETPDLEAFLKTTHKKNLFHYTAVADPAPVACFRLLLGAQREGWTGNLVSRLSAAFPHIPEFAQLASQLGLSGVQPRREFYVSCAWGDDSPEGRDREAAIDRLCAGAEQRGARIVRDKTSMAYGDSVSEFMARAGAGDRVFIILSDRYLKSPSCMSELFDLWRACKENEAELLRRARVFALPCAGLQTREEREARAAHWREIFEKREAYVKEHGQFSLPARDFAEHKLIGRFVGQIADILSLVQDTLRPHGFDDFVRWGFDDPQDTAAPRRPLWKTFTPYRGLLALRECDGDFLFGRDQCVDEVIDAVATRQSQILLALGGSGVGKSSLIFAGVFGALNRERLRDGSPWPLALTGSRDWPRLTLTPGEEPLLNLAGAFVRQWMDPAAAGYRQETGKWRTLLMGGDGLNGLVETADEARRKRGGARPERYLIYVDQGEELYTHAGRRPELDGAETERPETERPETGISRQGEARRFAELLAAAAAHPRLIVLMSARSDFLPHLQADGPIFARRHQLDVAPLKREGLANFIRDPASRLGVSFQDDLDKKLASAASEQAGGLPLLSDTLESLWKEMQARDEEPELRWSDADGETVDISRKLAERADAFMARHEEQRAVLRRLFCVHLACVSPQGAATRRRASFDELSEDERALVEELASDEQCLLTVSSEEGRAWVEVAHETLFGAWGALRNWIGERQGFYAWRAQIEAEREDWERRGRPPEALLTARPLERARAFLESDADDTPEADASFIRESLTADEDRRARETEWERKQQDVKLQAARRLLQHTTAGLLAAVVLAVLMGWQWWRAV